MHVLYNLGIYGMSVLMPVMALFHPKARAWVKGRRGQFTRLKAFFDSLEGEDRPPVAWFHAASLGEFEQGRPVIEAFRAAHSDYKILLTFFSPSGYEIRKNYPGADYICYLPSDTPCHVRRFLSIVRPSVVYFIKYEFWVNYLLALGRGGIPTYIFSAIFRADQLFFRPYGALMRRALRVFTCIFVQNEESKSLLEGIGLKRVCVAGDTRFDRVAAIARGTRELPEVARFAEGAALFVGGSTWPPDEELILELIRQTDSQSTQNASIAPESLPTTPLKFILAPHEIDSARIDRFIASCPMPCLRYTELTPESDLASARVLFIDTIGILSSVYRYGRWAYIGGGFGVGIHNTLEAATFGLPLVFGPRYEKFQEARELIACGGAHSISTLAELTAWFHAMRSDSSLSRRSGTACSTYVSAHTGATPTILSLFPPKNE